MQLPRPVSDGQQGLGSNATNQRKLVDKCFGRSAAAEIEVHGMPVTRGQAGADDFNRAMFVDMNRFV
jgi:hypothetical protein